MRFGSLVLFLVLSDFLLHIGKMLYGLPSRLLDRVSFPLNQILNISCIAVDLPLALRRFPMMLSTAYLSFIYNKNTRNNNGPITKSMCQSRIRAHL